MCCRYIIVIYLCYCVMLLLLLYFIGAGKLVRLHHAKERVLGALGLNLHAQRVRHIQGQPAGQKHGDYDRPPGLTASHANQ